jgi:hypothetical protein
MQRKTRQTASWWASDDRADLIEDLRVTQVSEGATFVLVQDILGIDTADSMKIGWSHGFGSPSPTVSPTEKNTLL